MALPSALWNMVRGPVPQGQMQGNASPPRWGGLGGLGGLSDEMKQKIMAGINGMGQGAPQMDAPPAYMPQAQMGQVTRPQGTFQMPQPGSMEYERLMMLLRGRGMV